MTDKIKVKPGVAADGTQFVITNHLTGQPIAADGEVFEVDRTISRRLADRDLVEVKPESAEPRAAEIAPAPAPTAPSKRS